MSAATEAILREYEAWRAITATQEPNLSVEQFLEDRKAVDDAARIQKALDHLASIFVEYEQREAAGALLYDGEVRLLDHLREVDTILVDEREEVFGDDISLTGFGTGSYVQRHRRFV